MEQHAIYTTGQVAEIFGVTTRHVCQWFDSGRMRGYRIPGSQDRRIAGEHIEKFADEYGIQPVKPYQK